MADDIEAELESQLSSQREALVGIDEAIALSAEGSASEEGVMELLQMREELCAAVSELESALLEIKRARILQQLAARTALPSANWKDPGPQPHQQQPVMSTAVPPPAHPATPSCPPCHFRYMDGRWYAGRVIGPGRQASTTSVAFEVPTRPFMLDPVDVMDALVRSCGASPTSATGAAAATGPQEAPQQWLQQPPPPPPQQQQLGGRGSGGAVGSGPSSASGELEVGRKALARLPGSRLFVPVEVVGLDAVRETVTVLPLVPQVDSGRGARGGGGGGGGGEVVIPLSEVTRHAHVPPPPPLPPAAGGGRGGGGGGSDSDDSDDGNDDGDGSSTSVSALLRHAVTEDDDSDAGDTGDDDGDEYGDGDGEYDDDNDVDMYDSDGDDGDSDVVAVAGGRAASASGRRGGCTSCKPGDDGDAGDDGGGLDVLAHARLAAAAGAVDDTALLADWEVHGRGVASRLLVRMGYVRGQGLGTQGQGTLSSPEVLLLPERKGLGAVDKNRVRRVGGRTGDKLQGGVAKRKRGGSKQRRKEAIAANREARTAVREAEEGAPGGGGLFDFINSSLGDGSAASRIRKAQAAIDGAGGASRPAGAAAIAGAVSAAAGGPPRRGPDRRSLMNHHDNVAGIQTKLARLQEMLGRHKDNRGLRVQIEAQIRAVQAELAAAQSAAARASKAISDKDAQKKWLKF